MRTKCYLDVDGTLLDKHGQPAGCLHDFIEYVTEHYECYWLKTHVRDGTLGYLFPYLERAGMPPETLELLHKVQPTTWDMLKTEAIDLQGDCIWFDDQPTSEEMKRLKQAGKASSLVVVDRERGQGLCEWMKAALGEEHPADV